MQIKINQLGHLTVGGCDTLALTRQYGTPLIVYDVQQIRSKVRAFQTAFLKNGITAVISYASKAFCAKALYQVLAQEKTHVDVVSLGELITALQAGFSATAISFHGNNKSYEELDYALKKQVGLIIIDNFRELALLKCLLKTKYPQQNVQVLLRINPGITAHTHEYIQTGQEDSKFGFDVRSGQAEQALQQVLATPRMKLMGLHAHIGSQIMIVGGFSTLVASLCRLAEAWWHKYNYVPQILNVGGGFGIRYTSADQTVAPRHFVDAICQTLKKHWTLPKSLPQIWIEPGRSLVGEAGTSLYTVGAQKNIPGIRTFVSVDGGMGDNIRPALYQAEYEAVLANDAKALAQKKVTIAGRYCESGDVLVTQQELPPLHEGDVLAILVTGAYGYSMASNYNRVSRPAVVFVENGQSQIVIKRETVSDMLKLDCDYKLFKGVEQEDE